MAIEVDHNCDGKNCRSDAEYCYCNSHYEEKLEEAYNDGYQVAKKEFESK
jgi:hypothetical protein